MAKRKGRKPATKTGRRLAPKLRARADAVKRGKVRRDARGRFV